MKRALFLGLIMSMVMVFGADIGASAVQSNEAPTVKHSVTIVQDATVGGQAVEQGKYDVEITGGADATLVFKRGKQEIARARVKRAELTAPAKYDRVDLRNSAAGKEVITLYFKGDRGSFQVLDDQGVALADKP